jgi:hypothetical protein
MKGGDPWGVRRCLLNKLNRGGSHRNARAITTINIYTFKVE